MQCHWSVREGGKGGGGGKEREGERGKRERGEGGRGEGGRERTELCMERVIAIGMVNNYIYICNNTAHMHTYSHTMYT